MARGLRKIARSDASEFSDPDVVPLNPVETAPQSVGALLQAKRAEFGVDLREAADYLRIRYAYLLAIEEGRVDDLPGAAYAMGFVRAYADYLGLDGAAIVERYKDETAELGDDVRLVFPSRLPEGKIPSGAIILVGVLLLGLVYGGWAIFAQQDVKIAELVPALPERFSSLLGSDEAAESRAQQGVAEQPSSDTAPPVKAEAKVLPPSEPKPVETTLSATETTPSATETAAPTTEAEPTTPPVATVPQPETQEDVASVRPDTVVSDTAATVASSTAAATESESAQQPVTPPVQEAEVQTPEAAASASETQSTETASNSETAAESVASAPSNETENRPAESPPQTPVQETVANPPVDQTDTPTNVPVPEQESVEQAQQALQETQETASTLPPSPPAVASAEPRQFGSDNAESRIVIEARVDSWVEIRAGDVEKLLTRVLRAGDTYRVPNRPGLLMETGNAGGLQITIDGDEIPDLGPMGAVRRNIALDAETLKAGGSR